MSIATLFNRESRLLNQHTHTMLNQPFFTRPIPIPTVPVLGLAQNFPIHRIYCVGCNYSAHAHEMGHHPKQMPPFFFCKPADTARYITPGMVGEFPYPSQSNNVQHEIELVAALSKQGRNIPVEQALDHVLGYAFGLDMTCRDLQTQMKKLGQPWEIAKSFDHSAPIGPIVHASDIGHDLQGTIWLKVNGKERQCSNVSQLIWSVAQIVSSLSKFFELFPGDLIFTGTPDGVGPVVRGDVMTGGIDGLGEFEINVV